MEVSESRMPASVGPTGTTNSSIANSEQNHFFGPSLLDDDRSSSLSEIDDVSDEPSDYEFTKPELEVVANVPENDSEAETERIEDSPNSVRSRRNIVVSGSAYGVSPSKLAQSTTYDDAEDADEQAAEYLPSKSGQSSNNGARNVDSEFVDGSRNNGDSTLSTAASKKRKRFVSGDDTGTELGDEEPFKKRRSSTRSDLSDLLPDDIPPSPGLIEDTSKVIEEEERAVAVHVMNAMTGPNVRAKKAKKSKRQSRRGQDTDDDTEAGGLDGGTEEPLDYQLEDDDHAEHEEVDDVEATPKLEEESAKKSSAMESLAVLEKEFAILRDKIYDERISKLNRELEMLQGPNPTHAKLQRQLENVRRYRDDKIQYEQRLYDYRVKALLNRSLAERAQIHSMFFQRVRDARERHSSAVSQQFYAIQHDRFKTEETGPHHWIPFPTRRSQQVVQQMAYNQEVSIMAGVAKYVGFPAAPTLSSARPSELEEDFEKIGISLDTRQPAVLPTTLPRGTLPAISSSMSRTAAEEAFLEHTPWANPQHPIHHQQVQQTQPNHKFELSHLSSFTTPASQTRAVDVHLPQGSASTIPEYPGPTSSAKNTPYGTEEDQRRVASGVRLGNAQEEEEEQAAPKSGFRSSSASPLDVRKPHPLPPSISAFNHKPHDPRSENSLNTLFSPSSDRLDLFRAPASPKRDSPPSLVSARSAGPGHNISRSIRSGFETAQIRGLG